MGRAIGGDILEITFNHPTKGTLTVYPKAGVDSTLDPGGFRSQDSDDGIDGAGQMIDQMNRTRPSLETTLAWDSNQDLTLHSIAALAGDPVQSDITISHSNGSVYGGKGKPVGDVKGNWNNGTFALKMAGDGEWKIQA